MKKLGVALAAIALGAVTAAPASAASEGNSIIEITSVATGQCLQTEATGDHPALRTGTCEGARNQRWERIEVGDAAVMLRNLATRQCVDERYELANWWCDDEAATQFGQLAADQSGSVRIKYGEQYADSTTGVWPRDYADSDHQRWLVRETGRTTPVDTTGETVRIENANRGCISVQTGKCMTVRNPSGLSGVNVIPDCDPANVTQHWTLETGKAGATRIRASADQRYLTPAEPNIYAADRQTGPAHNTWQSWYLTAA